MSSSSSFLNPFTLNKPFSLRFHKPLHLVASASASATATDQTTARRRFAAEMAGLSSFYDVLGIPMTANCREVKSAYRKLARTCHPDVVAVDLKERSAGEFMKIQVAYSTLSDPDKRATYDREICRGRMGLHLSARRSPAMATVTSPPVSGYSAYCTRRNWESDQFW